MSRIPRFTSSANAAVSAGSRIPPSNHRLARSVSTATPFAIRSPANCRSDIQESTWAEATWHNKNASSNRTQTVALGLLNDYLTERFAISYGKPPNFTNLHADAQK